MILDGQLPGDRHGNRWYIKAPLVNLVHPDASTDTARLRISACRLGCYLTAGRGNLELPLAIDDPGRFAALAALKAAMNTDNPPEAPLDIHLNGMHFMVDSSLWLDLGAALVEYQTLTDPSIEELF
jgi:hypothetical protein